MFLLIDNYDSFTYNLYALFRSCGASLRVIKNSQYEPAGEYEGIILSPGPSRPENSGTTLRFIAECIGHIPLFGVCLGMQALGHSLGFPVIPAPTIMHGKADSIEVTGGSVLFDGISAPFQAVRYHSLAVDAGGPPVTARARSDRAVMAIEDPARAAFGVQFHPESVLSEEGERIVNNFIGFARSFRRSNGRTDS